MSSRVALFAFVAALPLTLVRFDLQYDEYIGRPWIFLMAWAVDYLLIGVVGAFASSLGDSWRKKVMPYDEAELTVDRATFSTSVVAIFGSLLVWIIAHWPDQSFDDY